ncbi:hypothetical protein [Lysinibacillus xylanilyticus]|uniref:hypothetical protein n=1 Tax=Lysinibacillus xylanilyticus TaxID=582475 RepID=UPI0036DB1A2A
MPVIVVPTNKFEDLKAIYKEFTEALPVIFFEKDTYEHFGLIQVQGQEIHVYRCEKEMHQLHITLQGGVPVLVEGSYSIKKH